MKEFNVAIEKIKDEKNRSIYENVLEHIAQKYPDLNRVVKWSQPMFAKNDTFIISLEAFKNHFNVVAESKTIGKFKSEIEKSGYIAKDMSFSIKYSDEIDFDLIDEIIEFQIEDKKDCESFWRK